MLQANMLLRVVAGTFQCHPSNISRLQARFQDTGTIRDSAHDGRPLVTTAICLRHFRNHFATAAETARQTPGCKAFVTYKCLLVFIYLIYGKF